MATRRKASARRQPLQLRGSLWVSVDGRSLGGHGRITLLQAVAEQGSITRAAQAFGMSYKAAWDAIEAMNSRSGTPLVERATGGRGGGGTRLTEQGRRLVERYAQVDRVHQQFLHLLEEGSMDLEQEFSLLKVLNMKTSARNQWLGSVVAVRAGAVNDEVEIALEGGARVAAIVTRESTEALALRPRQTVVVLAKSQTVLLARDLGAARVSTRNRLEGTVHAVKPGAVNAEVLVQTPQGLPVVAIVGQETVADLALAPGVAVTVLLKASDLILATVP